MVEVCDREGLELYLPMRDEWVEIHKSYNQLKQSAVLLRFVFACKNLKTVPIM